MSKQTAGNNVFLANVRTAANDAIYKKAAELLNAEGLFSAAYYLARHFKLDFTQPLPASYLHAKAAKLATFAV